MAGMLPGVECARRRRFHQAGGSMDSPAGIRRPSFCLYTTAHETNLGANAVQQQRSYTGAHGAALGSIAREAKERLDGRLRSQRASDIKRSKNGGCDVGGRLARTAIGNLQREVFSSKKSSRKFGWMRLGWKASEQDECVVCLEEFRDGDGLLSLPCEHRFHWSCVLPWLESSAQCPCCRMSIY